MASSYDPRMNNRTTFLKSTMEKLAEKQMKNGLHARFLENCLEDNIVPKGLRLSLKVHIGNDVESRKFQESIDSLLEKVSLEVCERLKEEHQRRMLKLGKDLEEHRTELKSLIKGNIGIFDEELYKKTESKKDGILPSQLKKLENLQREKNRFPEQRGKSSWKITSEKSKKYQQPKESAKDTNFISVKSKRAKTKNLTHNTQQPRTKMGQVSPSGITHQPQHTEQSNKPVQNNLMSNQAKNVSAPGTQKATYADVVKNGAKKNTKESSTTLITTMKSLIETLKDLLQTTQTDEKIEGLSEYRIRTDGRKKRKDKRKSKEEKKLY